MIKNILHSFLRKAKDKTKALALGVVLLLCAIGMAKAQNNLNILFYSSGTTTAEAGLDVSVLDGVFGTVTVNGNIETADHFNPGTGNITISSLATSVSGYAGIQMVVVNGFVLNTVNTISQQQADALIAYVKQGGVLVGLMEGILVTGVNQDFNKYVGERLLLQTGVNITATAGGGTVIPNPVVAYHNNNGTLDLNAAATSVKTTGNASTFSGIPSESIIYATAKPANVAQCTANRALDFVAPSYPGDANAIVAGINGFAYLSGESAGPLSAMPTGFTLYDRNNSQANINAAQLIYDFLYTPPAMATRRAWSKTPANINAFCPVTTIAVEGIFLTNTCPAAAVNLSSHHNRLYRQ